MSKSVKDHLQAVIIIIIAAIIPFVTYSSLMDVALLSKFLVIAGLLIFFFIYNIIKKKNESHNVQLIDFVFILYAVWQTLSIFWAHNFSEAVFSLATVWLFYFCYLATKLNLTNQKNFEQWFIPIISISSLALTLYGWYEFFAIDNFHRTNDTYIIQGFSAHKNLFSTQLFLLLPFLSIGFFTAKKQLKWFYALVLTLQLLLLFSLLSRAFLIGFTGTILVACISFFIKRKQTFQTLKPILLLITIVTITVFVIYNFLGATNLLQRYNFKNFAKSRNVKERIQIWKNTIELIKDKPILGYGTGNWDIFFPSKGINKIPRMAIKNQTISRPHNDYLWIAAETGIIGLLFYISLLILIYFYAISAITKSSNRTSILKLIFLISFFTGYLIIAFFDFPRERPELNFYVALIMAWLVYLSNRETSFKEIFNLKPFYQKILLAGVLILLCGIFYVGMIRCNGEQQIKKVKVMLQNKNWDKVISASKKIKLPLYTIGPTELPIQYYTCYAYFNKKDYQNTIEYGKRAIKDSPYHQSSLLQIATAYAELKNYNMGATYYEKALQMHPTNNRILESLAICYYNSNQTEKAKNLLKRVKSNHPSIKKMREVFNQ